MGLYPYHTTKVLKQMTDENLKTVSVQEFKQEMGKNPLGSDPLVRKVGDCYILEYYPDSIGNVGRLQLFRKALEQENHFRTWKQVSDFQDYDGDLKELFRRIDVSDCSERDSIGE